jgi:hypothetical protein
MSKKEAKRQHDLKCVPIVRDAYYCFYQSHLKFSQFLLVFLLSVLQATVWENFFENCTINEIFTTFLVFEGKGTCHSLEEKAYHSMEKGINFMC